ncbi:MAG: isoquinoline 1-oxidoreductase subunit beta [Candidatus Hydrogenedentota bacterium]
MSTEPYPIEPERFEFSEPPRYHFAITRRSFVKVAGAGLLITPWLPAALAQGRGGDRPERGRFHIDADGSVTVFTGKVEVGQGARTQIAQAAAEELHLPLKRVRVVMADTSIVPDDGGTYGSQTTPRTIPRVRQAAALARQLLVELACDHWGTPPHAASMVDGVIVHTDGRRMSLGELVAKTKDIDAALATTSGAQTEVSLPQSWTVMGQPAVKPSSIAIVMGAHQYASDMRKPGMLYGAVLRAPTIGAELTAVDTTVVSSFPDVVVVHDGSFVACAAPKSHAARKAVEAIAATARWTTPEHPSSATLLDYLKTHTVDGSGRQRSRVQSEGDVDAALAGNANAIRETYFIPYIQHAPLETRSAFAEWDGERVTVWTGTQRPFDVGEEVAEAFGISSAQVRLIVPDTGGGFGGKHSGEVAIEAARLAKAAGRPVSLQWSREEEFVWAYCRPAGAMDIAAALDADGRIVAWDFTNYNSGGSGLECPYVVANKRTRVQPCESPLRQGSYRALASTGNNFARETFMDLLAAEALRDPVAFRVAHLDDGRLKDVLLAVAEMAGWEDRRTTMKDGSGLGIACGTEKGSFVATCAEVVLSADRKNYVIRQLWVAYECGAVHNPRNLLSQVEGGVIMGLGAIFSEEVHFEGGKVTNPRFKDYRVPQFEDVPPIETKVLNRPDLDSVGAGETPIIAVAPAVANALLQATGKGLTALPLRLI